MPPSETTAARRLAAELELARAVQGVLIHELGNPLQSLTVLIELSRDDLREAGVEGRSVERLDHALESIERLRRILLASGRVRATLAASERAWAELLDDLLEFIDERLTQLRATLHRTSAAIDRRPVAAGPVAAAVLAALIGACEQIRDARRPGMILAVEGSVVDDRVSLRVSVDGPAGPVELGPAVVARVEDLLADDPGSSCERDGPSLRIRSE